MFATKTGRMPLPKFIFNVETKKNSHGFFLLNGGGRFDRFRENSVMLDNHDLDRLIGRWENLHTEGALLVADPVFDEGVALGAERKGQVERGFLRGASPGIIVLRAEYRTNPAGGEDLYVTEWELFEGSVTSVPSNAGAVTLKIYTGDGRPVEENDVRLHVDNIVKLCVGTQSKTSTINHMEKITLSAEALTALGITQDADAAAIGRAVLQLRADCTAANDRVEALQKEVDDARKRRAEQLVNLAVEQGRIGANSRDKYIELALKDYDLVSETLKAIPEKVSLAAAVSKIAGGVIPTDRQNWTHLRWLKEDPAGLAKIKAENHEAFEAIRKVRN